MSKYFRLVLVFKIPARALKTLPVNNIAVGIYQ